MDKKLEEYYIAQWLEGEISDHELKVQIGVEAFKEYQKLKQSFKVLQFFNATDDARFSQIKQKIQAPKRRKNISMYYKWAMGVAVAVLIFVGISLFKTTEMQTYQTAYAQQQNIVLPDGSKVVLGAHSVLKYKTETWSQKRELFLTGKAYFSVKKGETFKVITQAGEVSVLGTKFEVIARKNHFDVTCFEGKVAVVTAAKNKYILKPEMRIQVIDKQEKSIKIAAEKPNWLAGYTSFEQTPLYLVAEELTQQYGIEITNLQNKNILFTGSFPNDNLSLALSSVFKPLGYSYTLKGKLVILTPKK